MTRPKDHLIAAAVSEISRLGPVCGTHQSFRQRVSQIVVPLAEAQRPLGAQMARLNENLTAANARIVELETKLNEVHSWIVCAAIASPDDMMQNAERIEEITRPRQ